MRFVLTALLSTLLATQAFAADIAPLPPGKPAGLHQAQEQDDHTLLYALGAAAIIAGVVLLATSGNNNTSNPVSSTTSTSP